MAYKKLDDFLKPREIQTTNIQPQSQQQKQEEPRYEIVGFYRETQFQEISIGKIPKEWKLVKLGLVVSKIKGKKPEDICEDDTHECLPYLEAQVLRGIEAPKYVKPQNGVVLGSGDIVMIWDGSYAGEVFLIKERGILASTMVKLVPKSNELDMRYLYYWLLHKGEPLRKQRKGTGIPHVSEQIFSNLPIALPPLEEQWGIAELLSSVDKAIEAVDRLIQKLESVKKALMQELLTKGIGHKELQETPIGKMPKEWKVVELKDVTVLIKTGPFGSQLRKSELTSEGIKVYTQENVLLRDFSLGNMYISIEKFRQLRSFEVKPGDILLTIRGTLGKAAVVPENAERGIIHTNLAIIRVDNRKISEHFLEEVINYSDIFIRQIKSIQSATTLPALYATVLKSLKVPLPPLEEQQQIVSILKSIDNWLELEKRRREKIENIKRSLVDLLLTGKVRVKVAVR